MKVPREWTELARFFSHAECDLIVVFDVRKGSAVYEREALFDAVLGDPVTPAEIEGPWGMILRFGRAKGFPVDARMRVLHGARQLGVSAKRINAEGES